MPTYPSPNRQREGEEREEGGREIGRQGDREGGREKRGKEEGREGGREGEEREGRREGGRSSREEEERGREGNRGEGGREGGKGRRDNSLWASFPDSIQTFSLQCAKAGTEPNIYIYDCPASPGQSHLPATTNQQQHFFHPPR